MPDEIPQSSPASVPTTPDPNQQTTGTTRDPVFALLDRFAPEQEIQDVQMMTHRVRCVSVTVGELKAAIARNPTHEIAGVYAGAIQNLKDHEEIALEQPDLQALIQNRKVETRTDLIDGVRVRTKTVV